MVWDEGKNRGEQSKRLMDKFRELNEMTGKTAYLYITTKRIDNDGNKIERGQILTKIGTDGSDRDCYENLMRMKDFMINNGRNSVALYPPGDGRRGDTFRKMVEWIFGDSSMNCCVYQSNSKKEMNQGEGIQMQLSSARRASPMRIC